jgi:hypothetical protein
MLSVRKNLTEILLEVTNEEIATIAKETLSKVRRKGRNDTNIIFISRFIGGFTNVLSQHKGRIFNFSRSLSPKRPCF